ncbi:MAG: hypothetical protein SVQ76_01295 [Candidatus Nanohaloarchaea archaeon]|nr:hypothetical protein [Candidatus Nanohaloarchaea archaeon]
MATLDAVIGNLQRIGLFNYALPFLLTFAAVYGILENLDLFGGDTEKINGIIAAVAGFFVMNYTATAQLSLGVFFTNFFGAFSVVLVFLLGIVMAAGLAGSESGRWEGAQTAFLVLGALAAISIFISRGGLSVMGVGELERFVFMDTTTFWTLLVVLGAIGAIYWVAGGGGGGASEESE